MKFSVKQKQSILTTLRSGLIYSSASAVPSLRCKCFSRFWNSVKPFPLPVTPTLPLGSSGDLKMLSLLWPEKKPVCTNQRINAIRKRSSVKREGVEPLFFECKLQITCNRASLIVIILLGRTFHLQPLSSLLPDKENSMCRFLCLRKIKLRNQGRSSA